VRFLREHPNYVVVAGIAVIIVVLLFLTSCGADKAQEPFKDAPRGQTNDDPADVIEMPDGFSNLAAKCDGTNRVYVAFHGDSKYGAVAVSPNDPACGGTGTTGTNGATP
jgi:hypothetical protein